VRILAIDPGPTECGYVVLDGGELVECGIVPTWHCANFDIFNVLFDQSSRRDVPRLVVEMIASYGMPVGIETFETCYWIGAMCHEYNGKRIYRSTIKHHLCGSAKAKDGNIRQALIDRFGPGRELAIGTKKNPGPLYGISSHCWAALALAVTYQDLGEACCVDPAREMAAKSARRQLKREKRKAKEVSK